MVALDTLSAENIERAIQRANQEFGGQPTAEPTASAQAAKIASTHSLAQFAVSHAYDVNAAPFNQQPSGRSI